MTSPSLLALALALAGAPAAAPSPGGRERAAATPPAALEAAERARATLVARHGEGERARIERGVAQVLSLWRPSDGDPAALEAFLAEHFAAGPSARAALLDRFEEALEALDGGFLEQSRALQRRAVLDLGPLLPVDGLLAAVDPGAHLVDDLFDARLAFVALLNFPVTSAAERERAGARWSRQEWAETRLAGRFALRMPAEVSQGIARASAAAEAYVARGNIFMHHLLVDGARPFPRGLRLLSHWNLRDQLKAEYAARDGLSRQRVIAQVMERIVTSTVPAAVVDSPLVDWDPFTNAVAPAAPGTVEDGGEPPPVVDPAREPDTRYARLLDCFRAVRAGDPHAPSAPTFVERRFEHDRQLSEARVRALLDELLRSPLLPRLARVIEARLGRPLQPFDLWYDGFRPRARLDEARLDALTRARYPTASAFQADLPRVLERLGFAPARARWLAERIVVEPARGSGHALEAARRGDFPRLRTRVGPGGMDHKGFDIAIHELGHNVEQVFSLYEVDRTLLRGVPNTAITEALAFVFQARALEVLGQPGPTAEDERLLALHRLWAAFEIAGPALVDLEVWGWMYAHPEASPAELREATLEIAREVWNRHYAPLLGRRDVHLLAVYSHMVSSFLYLPDYPLGELVAAQLEERLRGRPLGPEVERVARFGAVTPDLWMRHATGAPLSAAPLLRAAERALDGG